MLMLLKFVRKWIGGKSEAGVLAFIFAAILWLVWPAFDTQAFLQTAKLIGMLTGVALLDRIEDKEGFLNALKSIIDSIAHPLQEKKK